MPARRGAAMRRARPTSTAGEPRRGCASTSRLLDDLQRPAHEMLELLVGGHVGRHEVNRAAYRSEQEAALERLGEAPAREVTALRPDIECGDHAAGAKALDIRMLRE